MPYGKQTLREMAKRLTEIVERNDLHGFGERNDLPVAIEILRTSSSGRYVRNHYVTAVRYVSDSELSLSTPEAYEKFGASIAVDESKILKR